MIISNWGNYPRIEANIHNVSFSEDLAHLLNQPNGFICRGNGRSYGDASLNADIISMINFNRFISLDKENDTITSQSGVLLADILSVIVPRGYFLPVTPGTKLITIGGAVAANVHGKNHHSEGSFSNHIVSMRIMQSDGQIKKCSPTENTRLFWETFGAMGLTGVIIDVTFKLKRIETNMIIGESIKVASFLDAMENFENSDSWTYSVAWIDCLAKGKSLGRSILMRGEHAERSEVPINQKKLNIVSNRNLNVPFYFPSITLNKYSVSAFNAIYFNKQRKKLESTLQDYDSFFYPLDFVNNWNRIYGKRGFTQYQCAIPLENSEEGLKELLEFLATKGKGSFLAVLKRFGKMDSNAANSFPIEGYTLALDFNINKGIQSLLLELDEIVLKHNGRLYLAKDSMCSKFELVSYTRSSTSYFDQKFCSLQSSRIDQLEKLN
jgi:FAD/FMN-containing dehydrogenase